MSNRPELDDKLSGIVEAIRLPDESIWDVRTNEDGSLSVYLITSAAIEQASRMVAIGLAGGEGRAFQFKCVNGDWTQTGESHWIG